MVFAMILNTAFLFGVCEKWKKWTRRLKMKAILEFEMYSEKQAFEYHYRALDYLAIIDDFDNWLRDRDDDGIELIRDVWVRIKQEHLD
jgi:hypothetical protein